MNLVEWLAMVPRDLRERVLAGMLPRLRAECEQALNHLQSDHPMTADQALGRTYRDNVTGFEGLCTAFIASLTACNQLWLQPRIGADGKLPDGHWFDETRLMDLGVERVTIPAASASPGAETRAIAAAGRPT